MEVTASTVILAMVVQSPQPVVGLEMEPAVQATLVQEAMAVVPQPMVAPHTEMVLSQAQQEGVILTPTVLRLPAAMVVL
tara:strand:+ start:41 stop:277 length:237 start_codon:yes stop_codon:yes gene_type:complete